MSFDLLKHPLSLALVKNLLENCIGEYFSCPRSPPLHSLHSLLANWFIFQIGFVKVCDQSLGYIKFFHTRFYFMVKQKLDLLLDTISDIYNLHLMSDVYFSWRFTSHIRLNKLAPQRGEWVSIFLKRPRFRMVRAFAVALAVVAVRTTTIT